MRSGIPWEATAIVDVDDPQQEEITSRTPKVLHHRAGHPLLTVAPNRDHSRLLGRNSRAYAETIVAVSRTGVDLPT